MRDAFGVLAPEADPVRTERVYASWGRRALAAIIDGFVILGLALILFVPLAALGLSFDTDGGLAALIVVVLLGAILFSLAALVYQPLMMWQTNGRTLGKMATGIRVVKTDGTPMDIVTAILREVVLKNVAVGAVASVTFSVAYLVDWLWPLFDAEKRALHDIPVNTRVVRA